MVSPSAAVTVTVKVFSPTTNSLPPVISTVASESEASAITSTSVVNGARSTVSPSSTETPSTVKVAKLVSLLRGIDTVTVWSSIVSPSAAVTVTVMSL